MKKITFFSIIVTVIFAVLFVGCVEPVRPTLAEKNNPDTQPASQPNLKKAEDERIANLRAEWKTFREANFTASPGENNSWEVVEGRKFITADDICVDMYDKVSETQKWLSLKDEDKTAVGIGKSEVAKLQEMKQKAARDFAEAVINWVRENNDSLPCTGETYFTNSSLQLLDLAKDYLKQSGQGPEAVKVKPQEFRQLIVKEAKKEVAARVKDLKPKPEGERTEGDVAAYDAASELEELLKNFNLTPEEVGLNKEQVKIIRSYSVNKH